MTRAVLDPGVLVSALLSPGGTPAQLVREWIGGGFELIVSAKLLGELALVLSRPKFRDRVTRDQARALLVELSRLAVVVEDPPNERGLTPDPDDDYLAALARESRAVLVSGDKGLTRLRDLPVMTPRAFLDALGQRP